MVQAGQRTERQPLPDCGLQQGHRLLGILHLLVTGRLAGKLQGHAIQQAAGPERGQKGRV